MPIKQFVEAFTLLGPPPGVKLKGLASDAVDLDLLSADEPGEEDPVIS